MRKTSAWLWVSAILVYLFLYVPLTVVVVYSFNDSRLNAEWVGFTWRWYQVLFQDEEMIQAALNSVFIALSASLIATVLGTMAGIAIHRYKLRLLILLAARFDKTVLRGRIHGNSY